MLKLVQTIAAHEGKGWSVAWNPTGDKLASCGEDKVANIWYLISSENTESSSNVSPKTEKDDSYPWGSYAKFGDTHHQRSLRDVAWSPCGKFVVLASFDAQVTLWEVKSKGEMDMISIVEGHENEVKSVDWSPSGKYFASSGRDKNVMIWTIISDKEIDVECSGVLTVHTQDVKRVIWHPHEDILASASYDDTVKLYVYDDDNGDWASTANLVGHESTVWAIDFDSTGNRLVSCSDDKTVKVWEKRPDNQWSCVCTLGGYHTRPIYDISWNKKNGLIATACGDDQIRIFKEIVGANELERNKFELLFTIKAHKGDINNVKWNPVLDGILASISDDGSVSIWEWKDEL